MITSPEELKILSEQRIISKDPNKEKEEKKSLSEKVRDKWHNTLFNKNTNREEESEQIKKVVEDSKVEKK